MAALFLLEPGIASFSDRAIGIAVGSDSSLLARLYAYVLALTALTALCCAYFLFSNTSPEGNTDTATDPTLFGLLSLCAGLNLLGAFVTGDTYLYLATAILSQTIAVFWLARNWLAGKAGDTPGDSREFLRHLCLSWQGTLTLFLLLKLSSMDLFWLAWCLSLVTILALPYHRPQRDWIGLLGAPCTASVSGSERTPLHVSSGSRRSGNATASLFLAVACGDPAACFSQVHSSTRPCVLCSERACHWDRGQRIR